MGKDQAERGNSKCEARRRDLFGLGMSEKGVTSTHTRSNPQPQPAESKSLRKNPHLGSWSNSVFHSFFPFVSCVDASYFSLS